MGKEEVDMVKNIWWNVHKEDHEMCERLQEGRSSPASEEGGLLSPVWEKGVRKVSKTYNTSNHEVFKKIIKRKKKCLKEINNRWI